MLPFVFAWVQPALLLLLLPALLVATAAARVGLGLAAAAATAADGAALAKPAALVELPQADGLADFCTRFMAGGGGT